MSQFSEVLDSVLKAKAEPDAESPLSMRALARAAELTPGFLSQLRHGLPSKKKSSGGKPMRRVDVLPSPRAVARICAALDEKSAHSILCAYIQDIEAMVAAERK